MSENNYEFIRFHQDRRAAYIVMSRPESLNALNSIMIDEMLHAISTVNEGTRVLVLRGEGKKAFAAGADIRELDDRTAWTEMGTGARRELARQLESAPYITLAAINGIALGGGLELALACHLRMAAMHARVGLPETRLGVIPGNGGTIRLTSLIGKSRALKMILLGEQVSAQEAFDLGIVNWIVAEEEFEDKLDDIVNRLALVSPTAATAAIDSVTNSQAVPRERAIEYEHRWFQICLESSDKEEGVRAFKEKRKPAFKGY